MKYLIICTYFAIILNSLKTCNLRQKIYNKRYKSNLEEIQVYDENISVKQNGNPDFEINLCKVLNNTCTESNIICQFNSGNQEIKINDDKSYNINIRNNKNCILSVKFQCKDEMIATLENSSGCNYQLLYPSVNCLRKLSISDLDIQIDSNELYNLESIEISSKNDKKRICICSCSDVIRLNINTLSKCLNGDLAVCEVNSQNHITGIISTNMAFSYEPYSGLKLHFNKGHFKTTVQIFCGEKPSLNFIRIKKKLILLEYITTKACVHLPVNISCQTRDNRHFMYDLSALKNKRGLIYLPTSNSTIHINVCSMISENIPANCSKTNSFSCLIKSNGQSKNLGSFMNPLQPKVTDDVLHINYISGMTCKDGNRANITIEFKCSFMDFEPELKKIIEDECSYIILWRTKHACPLATIVGEDCRVQDLFTSYTFDLSLLHSHKDHIIESHNDEKFRINICGVLTSPCAGANNVSICYLPKNGSEVPIAYDNRSVLFVDGRLELNFIGQPCRKMYSENSRVKLFFKCTESENDEDIPEIFPYHDDKCEFHILWKTSLACPKSSIPFNKLNCLAENHSFSHLSRYSDNYEVSEYIKNSNVTFVLNICKPIVYNYGYTCNDFPGICMVNNSEPRIDRRFINIGDELSEPYYNKTANVFQIRYKFNFCIDGKGESVVDIKCDLKNESPKLTVKSTSDCYYHFILFTSSVCDTEKDNETKNDCESINENKSAFKENQKYIFEQCSIKDLRNTNIVNLKSIIGNKIVNVNDSVLNLCVNNMNVSINSALEYIDIIYMEESPMCSKCRNSTLLRIYCDVKTPEKYPEIKNKTFCRTEWHWKTGKICQMLDKNNSKEFQTFSTTTEKYISTKHISMDANKAESLDNINTVKNNENIIITTLKPKFDEMAITPPSIPPILKNELQSSSSGHLVSTILITLMFILITVIIYIFRRQIKKNILPVTQILFKKTNRRSQTNEDDVLNTSYETSVLIMQN